MSLSSKIAQASSRLPALILSRRESGRSTRRLFVAVLLLAVVPLGCVSTPRPEVQATVVHRGPLRVEVATNGVVEPVDDIEVRARLAGRIAEIPDDPGQRVQAGDVIVRFDDGPVAADLASAESERLAAVESLRAARARAAQVRQHAGVDADLYRQGGLSREAYDASQAELREAAAQLAAQEREAPLRVAAAEHRIAELTAQREATVVRAPFAGTIYKTEAKRGELVRLGDPLLRLADLDHLRVRANVDQVDLGRVQPGDRVLVSANAFPGRNWQGTITEVLPNVFVKESRSVAEALARLDPPTNGLVPGMTVDVDIIVDESPGVLQVPAQAIVYEGGAPFVYVIDGNRVRAKPVQIGLSSVTAAEIRGGLEDGALVVSAPAGLSDGMRVEVVKPAGS